MATEPSTPVNNLSQFLSWLMNTGRAPTTAGNYRNAVRAALAYMDGPNDVEALRDYAAGLAPSTRRQFLSAWRAFQGYYLSRGGDALPDPTAAQEDLPTAVGDALFVLCRVVGIPQRTLSALRWHHVMLDAAPPRVTDVYAKIPGTAFPLGTKGREALITLKEWAVPGDVSDVLRDSLPLAPLEPGSVDSRSASMLRKDVALASKRLRTVRAERARSLPPPIIRPGEPPEHDLFAEDGDQAGVQGSSVSEISPDRNSSGDGSSDSGPRLSAAGVPLPGLPEGT